MKLSKFEKSCCSGGLLGNGPGKGIISSEQEGTPKAQLTRRSEAIGRTFRTARALSRHGEKEKAAYSFFFVSPIQTCPSHHVLLVINNSKES